MSEMKQKQGGNDEDAPRCPPHLGFVGGLCSLCGAKEEDAEGGAPGIAVGHEMMKQGGDGEGSGDYARCVKEEDTEGCAPGVAVGHGMMKEEGNDHRNDDDAARCPGPHPEFVLGLSYRCGATEEEEEDAGGSASGVTVANIDEALVPPAPALVASTSIASMSDMATLMRERKLILVLDLDHTLINSTGVDDLSAQEQRNGFTPDTEDVLHLELFRLEYSDSVPMLLKLRPFVRGFLEQASSMFEMLVCTLGRQDYAKAIIDLLDPDGVYFGGRVVSRSRKESTQGSMKSLDVIPGGTRGPGREAQDELRCFGQTSSVSSWASRTGAAVVILDDTEEVWPKHLRKHNLILMDRYHYFASTCRKFGYDIPSLAEQLRDEVEQECSLAVVLSVLKCVHERFFDGGRADVREVIAEVRSKVLRGCTVVFSYLEEYMEDFPEGTIMWTLAERLGVRCREDVGETVTHVVAEDPASEKAQWARDNGKFLVSREWIKAANFRWCRVDERDFPVTARAS